jgi:hypothetical protein
MLSAGLPPSQGASNNNKHKENGSTGPTTETNGSNGNHKNSNNRNNNNSYGNNKGPTPPRQWSRQTFRTPNFGTSQKVIEGFNGGTRQRKRCSRGWNWCRSNLDEAILLEQEMQVKKRFGRKLEEKLEKKQQKEKAENLTVI